MKPRLLFVDDEPNVLRGLQRMLRPLRESWDIQYASNGKEAMEIMAKQPVDLIVTDMRMPGMDGAELLNHVMEDHPLTIRLALSGQSDKETLYRSAGPTHQFLTKPCSAETLVNTIARAFALRAILRSQGLSGLVSSTLTLPPVPELYTRVMNELQSGDPSIAKVGQIIEEDPGMSAKVLQWVNSAYVGLPERVTSAADAARFMGLEMIRALVLLVGVFSDEAREKLSPKFKIDLLWKHSMMVGACARAVYRTQIDDRKASAVAFTAGLLHDAGKLILATSCPDEYDQVIEVVERGEATSAQVELAIFGATHAEVGAYLLGLWGLPDPLVEAVAYHHRPSECLARGFGPLAAVHIANALDEAARHTSGPIERDGTGTGTDGAEADESLPELDRHYIGKLGLEEILPIAQEEFLGIGVEDGP